MAGGKDAVSQAKEDAEDHPEYGVEDMKGISFTKDDVLVAGGFSKGYARSAFQAARAFLMCPCSRSSRLSASSWGQPEKRF